MAYIDPGPTSSYSDPIYDRLDIMSKAMRRRWWVYVVAFLIVLGASIAVRSAFANRSDQASATTFSQAFDASDPLANVEAFKDLAQNQKADPYYRARAWIELVQSRINNNEADSAKTAAEQAVIEAKRSGDGELIANALLSLAAAEFQRNDFDGALADYQKVDQASARYPVAQLEATLGEARCHEQLHQLPDAISTLEPLLSRSDVGSRQLVGLARVEYWNDRRLQDQATTGSKPSLGVPAPNASATAAAVQAAPAPVAQPAAASAPVPPRSAPAPMAPPAIAQPAH